MAYSNARNVPVRAAPPPPNLFRASTKQTGTVSRSSSQNVNEVRKKSGPPRPPPPKIKSVKSHAPAIPFLDFTFNNAKQQSHLLTSAAPPSTNDLLINWDSPPTSPSITRSSSDGLSLQSFGSDSSSTTTTGLNIVPRCESGFESENDFGCWSELTTNIVPTTKTTGTEASKSFVMPTIIRPNRLQSIPTASVSSSTHLQELAKVKTIPMTPKRSQVMDIFDLNDDDDDADDSIDSIKLQSADYSPPEPNIPPPALPSSLSVSPSKDFFASKRDACRQQAIATALFDYASCHSGDLNFTAGDRITLKKRVNEEWYEGSTGSHEGMFPASFVEILIPLAQESQVSTNTGSGSGSGSYQVVAMYPFQAETSQDLSLQEGDVLEVTEALGNGWLYGHMKGQPEGQRGQFPESFVHPVS